MRIFILILFLGCRCLGGPLMDKKIDGISLFQKVKSTGISEMALQRAFDFYDYNYNKNMEVTEGSVKIDITISNSHVMTIADFTLPSSQRRLYFIDLDKGTVVKYFVAHGIGSGGDLPLSFSNHLDSYQSSLGIYITGDTYIGSHGTSLKLYGLEKSNSNAWERNIVIHGADYISLEFLATYGRMGRSFGCPALSVAVADLIIPKIKNGSVFYIHHDKLITEALKNPAKQVLSPQVTPPPTSEEVNQ